SQDRQGARHQNLRQSTLARRRGHRMIRRREFISLLGGAAAAWPLAARARQSGKVARLGFLGATSATVGDYPNRIAALRSGLRDLAYVEGTNLIIEYRWAEQNYARLPALADELVRSSVDVIVTHGTPATAAAKRATTTIPIVMAIIGDPIAGGNSSELGAAGRQHHGIEFFQPGNQREKGRIAQRGHAATDARGCPREPGQSCNRRLARDGERRPTAQIAAAALPGAGTRRIRERI